MIGSRGHDGAGETGTVVADTGSDKNMLDVLITHSYFLAFDPKEYRAMMPYPPLGTLYAAAVLRAQGYTVALFDSMLAPGEQEISKNISLHSPRIVVIYDDDFNYLTKMCLSRMRTAAFHMSALAKQAGCTVIVHGSDATDHIDDYFDHDADFVVCGEGEETLLETVRHIVTGKPLLETIPGLSYRANGTTRQNAARPVRHDLDSFPLPARDLVDLDLYRRIWTKRHGYFSLNMVTTRGCPFHCNWCAKPIYGQVYNTRSPGNVVEEMLHVKYTIRPDHLWFCDDIFGLKPGWVAAFRDEVIRANAAIPFKCLSRVDLLLRDDTIRVLREAGCTSTWVGAESGSQKILDAMEKGTTVEQIYEASRRLHAAGIRVGFFLQYGYPGETREDIEKTLLMVRECAPDDIGVSVSYPLPGTRFYGRVREDLGGKHNWVDSEDLDLMYRGTYSSDFYRLLHRVTHKKFRVWQGVNMMKQTLSDPRTFSRQCMRRIASGAFHSVSLPPLALRLNAMRRAIESTTES